MTENFRYTSYNEALLVFQILGQLTLHERPSERKTILC